MSNPTGGRHLASLRTPEEEKVEIVRIPISEPMRLVQRRRAEGSREVEFRPVRPPLAPRTPSSTGSARQAPSLS